MKKNKFLLAPVLATTLSSIALIATSCNTKQNEKITIDTTKFQNIKLTFDNFVIKPFKYSILNNNFRDVIKNEIKKLISEDKKNKIEITNIAEDFKNIQENGNTYTMDFWLQAKNGFEFKKELNAIENKRIKITTQINVNKEELEKINVEENNPKDASFNNVFEKSFIQKKVDVNGDSFPIYFFNEANNNRLINELTTELKLINARIETNLETFIDIHRVGNHLYTTNFWIVANENHSFNDGSTVKRLPIIFEASNEVEECIPDDLQAQDKLVNRFLYNSILVPGQKYKTKIEGTKATLLDPIERKKLNDAIYELFADMPDIKIHSATDIQKDIKESRHLVDNLFVAQYWLILDDKKTRSKYGLRRLHKLQVLVYSEK
ncbi:hypothetical protein [Mycoplasmopsis lipofaciens]|uniref:hypothetical protein n=1 Tax=Mycoplasmopsis lipofaciens TaxID=114884 RepID=UPI0004827C6D|nr:hypothetical protein [Mycoplasmopsis lipofaciens]